MAGPLDPIRVIRPTIKRTRFSRVGEVPPSIRPFSPLPLSIGLNKVTPKRTVILSRRGLRFTKDARARLEARAVPESVVYGSVEERILYKELRRRNIQFDFQSSFFGARARGSVLGGLVADFVLHDRPVVINPLGRIWHEGREAEMRDIMQADELRKRGYEVWFIWDYQIHDEQLFREWCTRHLTYQFPSPSMIKNYWTNQTVVR